MTDKKYENYKGQLITVEITPYQYGSSYQALKAELTRLIKKECSYYNGLICSFNGTKTEINKKITVSGYVRDCEVDC